jgi:peptide/nickel transport system permease protein
LALLWQFCAQNPLGAAGGFVVIVMIAMAVLADVVTVYDPTRNNFGSMLEAPSREYWLGTDQFGRDLLSCRHVWPSRKQNAPAKASARGRV